jgi:hypothetical protein
MAGPSFTETRVPLILSFLAHFSSRDLDDFDEELLLSLSLSPLLLLSLLEGLRLLYFFDCASSVDSWTYGFFGCYVPCNDDNGSLQTTTMITSEAAKTSFGHIL